MGHSMMHWQAQLTWTVKVSLRDLQERFEDQVVLGHEGILV
jgi:hypothetical protein